MREVGVISWRRFEKFVISEGCHFKGIEGDHNKYKKPGLAHPIIIPRYERFKPLLSASFGNEYACTFISLTILDR